MRHARAAGGYKIHAVVAGTSLCGHTPTNQARSTMDRAKWIYYDRPVTCMKCTMAIAKAMASP